MKTKLPADCGNSPRISIVGDVVTDWARGDADAVSAWLMDEVVWTFVGHRAVIGEDVANRACPEGTVNYLEVTSIITHGRLASCDGFLESDSGRIAFSHVFKFASTTKSAKIKEARTYLVERPA